MLPGIVITPFSGALVDRWNRRTVMIVADSWHRRRDAGLAYYLSGHMQPGTCCHSCFCGAGRRLPVAGHAGQPSLMVPREQLSAGGHEPDYRGS
jgi:hypothetical protein